MGCFLGCFGFTKKERRRKSGSKHASGAQSYGRYVPLDSVVTVKLDNDEMQEASADVLRDKPYKESTATKIKKKVSFNLNVKTYEPLPNEEIEEETAGESVKYMNYEDNLMASKHGSFPANHRYQNCRDSFDDGGEEDEIELEEIDLEDDDEDELDFDDELDFVDSHVIMQLEQPPNQDVNKDKSNQNGRKRSQSAFSVLNPVQNITQWKEVKANSRQQLIKLQKENIMLEQEKPLPFIKKLDPPLLPLNPNRLKPSRETAVDASLSNWLVSTRT